MKKDQLKLAFTKKIYQVDQVGDTMSRSLTRSTQQVFRENKGEFNHKGHGPLLLKKNSLDTRGQKIGNQLEDSYYFIGNRLICIPNKDISYGLLL